MATQTFAYKVRDRQGKLVTGTLEAESVNIVAGKLRHMGFVPVSIESSEKKRGDPRGQDPVLLGADQAQGSGGLLPPVRHHDQLRADAPAGPGDPLRPDHQRGARPDRRRGPQRRREGRRAVGGDGQAPEGLLPPVRRHGALRRDGRFPRRRPQPAGHDHREAGRAAPQGEVGHDLPHRGRRDRGADPHGHAHLRRADVQGHVRRARLEAARADARPAGRSRRS